MTSLYHVSDKVTTDSGLSIPVRAEGENCKNDITTKVLQLHKTSESGVYTLDPSGNALVTISKYESDETSHID